MKGIDVDQLITDAWLRTLSRFPSDDEISIARQYIDDSENVVDGLTGLMWSLLNTKEFIVNH